MDLWVHEGDLFRHYYFLPPEHKRLEGYAEGLSFSVELGSSGEYEDFEYVSVMNFEDVSDRMLINSYFHKVQDLARDVLGGIAMQDLIETVEGWERSK